MFSLVSYFYKPQLATFTSPHLLLNLFQSFKIFDGSVQLLTHIRQTGYLACVGKDEEFLLKIFDLVRNQVCGILSLALTKLYLTPKNLNKIYVNCANHLKIYLMPMIQLSNNINITNDVPTFNDLFSLLTIF